MNGLVRDVEKRDEYLSFKLADEDYAVPIMSVREIRGWSHVDPLPGAPAHMRGMVNLRGALLPVLDLSVALAMPAIAAYTRNVVIVVNIGDRGVGLLVGAVSDILDLPESSLQPPPDIAEQGEGGYVAALAIVNNRMVRVLDLVRLVPQAVAEVA